MLVISRSEVEALLDLDNLIDALAQAMAASAWLAALDDDQEALAGGIS